MWVRDTEARALSDPDDDGVYVAKVERVLNSMEPDNRAILSMSLYEGYSHSEIATHMDLPLGTVKSRVRLAIRKLQIQID